MIKIRVGISKKTEKKYFCIVYISETVGDVVLTFDTQTVFKLSCMSYNELMQLAVGDYELGA